MRIIREWLSRNGLALFVCVFLLEVFLGVGIVVKGIAQGGLDLARHQSIITVTVTNGSATAFSNPLHRANFIQLTLNPGDAQVFTYCPPVGACAEVPSGQSYEIGPLREELSGGQALGTVQTATDGATLQVVAQRVRQ